jgi:hypothetical protein
MMVTSESNNSGERGIVDLFFGSALWHHRDLNDRIAFAYSSAEQPKSQGGGDISQRAWGVLGHTSESLPRRAAASATMTRRYQDF